MSTLPAARSPARSASSTSPPPAAALRASSSRPMTSGILVQASPVKKRADSLNQLGFTRPTGGRYALKDGRVVDTQPPPKKQAANYVIPPSQAPSTLSARLGAHRSQAAATARIETSRSTSFGGPSAAASGSSSKAKGKARETTADDDNDEERLRADLARKGGGGGSAGGVKVERDADSLRIVETLEMGPVEHGAGPEGDGRWASLEPNSQIRLSKRTLPHHLLQEHLSDSFFIPPSLLYSVINPSRDGTSFTVPVDGDWVTIAVVAEQVGPIRTTKGGPSMGKDEDSSGDEGTNSHGNPAGPKARQGKKQAFKPARLKKFVMFRLVALPPRSSGRSATNGDATVNMMLFEADSCANPKGGKAKVYKGGSGGAFEKYWNLKVGTVLAILNPRVLRPLKNAQSPHPLTNALALNPVSAETVIEIGHARDMGRCTALKADGARCSSWVDTRNGETCDYHVHQLHKKLRSGRAEFASSTSAFSVGYKASGTRTDASGTSGSTGRYIGGKGGRGGGAGKDEPNPKERYGLLPRNTREARQPTYVDGRHVVRDPAAAAGFEFVGEKIGRTADERRKRKRDEAEADVKIVELLGKDGGSTQGGKLLELARRKQRAEEREKENERRAAAGGAANGKGKGKAAALPAEYDDEGSEDDGAKKRKKSAFRPEHIKAIGFDPSMLATGALRADETPEEKKERLRAISLLVKNEGADEEKLDLRPITGRKGGWSSVKVPEGRDLKTAVAPKPKPEEKYIDLDSDDD